jgi:predicted dehydrogenase
MSSIKLAVIGTGLIGQKHLEIIRVKAECELVAMCDARPDGAVTAEKYGVPFYQDYFTLLAEQTLQGAIIATPTNSHAPVGIACAEQGVHILVEKPITATLAEAKQLLAAAERCEVRVLVGHHRRHNPLVQQTRDIVQSGQLGQLVGVSAMFMLLKPPDYYHVTWRTRPGGGPVLTNLIHDIDNLRYICGEIRSVYAVTSSAARGFAVEDTANLTLHFENGALGSILVSDTTPAPWSYELTSGENPAYPATGQDCYYFCGTEGALAFPSMTLWRYPQSQAAGWHHPLEQRHLRSEPGDPLTAQLAHFCRVIRGEEAPLVSGQEGLKTLAATQAVLESARCNLPVIPGELG